MRVLCETCGLDVDVAPGDAPRVAYDHAQSHEVNEWDAYRDAIDRVRALHPRSRHNPEVCAAGCGTYPCATLRALDREAGS